MPYGTVNADVITTSTAGGILGAGNASIMKNRIINGAMVIDQRNAGVSVTPTDSQYTLDRWKARVDLASKMSVQQSSTTPPTGFNYSLVVTSLTTTTFTTGGYYFMEQDIEGYNMADLGWGSANAKTVTISFWVKSSLTGTFGGSLMNSAQDRSYPFTYTISAANTWEQKTVTVAGDTTGTWLTTNGVGMRVSLEVGIGTSLSNTAGAWATGTYYGATGATNVLATNGATIQWTGVQLEVGSSATGFEYRLYNQELIACQRYYAKMSGGGFSNYCGFASGFVAATTQLEAVVKYPITMRASATLNYSNVRTNTAAGTNAAITSILASYAGTDSINASFNSTGSSMTLGQGGSIVGNNNSAAYLELSAEL
jgi:hypothetical protein